MTRWEYRHTPASTPLDELNALGADGWEVAGQADVVEQLSGGRRVETRDAGMVTGD
jgi:hypothetical protein